MKIFGIALVALAASPISAVDLVPRGGACPAIWKQVSQDLQVIMKGCTKEARQSIRAVFHDCFNNACDGSLILARDSDNNYKKECERPESISMAGWCQQLDKMRQKYNVGAADLINFAGAIAITSCTRGPKVPAYVGRTDSNVPAPHGLLPNPRGSVEQAMALFKAKGFTAEQVVALIGTHSVARQTTFDTSPAHFNKSLDSTPTKFDITYFQETTAGNAPFTLPLDKAMTTYSETRRPWAVYAISTAKWLDAFTPAWTKLGLLGNDLANMQDCSDLIPAMHVRRDEMEANESNMEKLRKKFMA